MKKLMFALAVAAMAVGAQASAFKWATSTGLVQAGSTETMASGITLYLVDITSSSQAAVFADLAAGNAVASVMSLTTGADGKITTTEHEYPTGTYDFLVYAKDGDNFFISNALTSKKVSTLSAVNVSFGLKSQSNSGTILNAGDGLSGAGWYAIPEPTSGLLMLVGLGALALRRRRA